VPHFLHSSLNATISDSSMKCLVWTVNHPKSIGSAGMNQARSSAFPALGRACIGFPAVVFGYLLRPVATLP
jgi:hypothetical protein